VRRAGRRASAAKAVEHAAQNVFAGHIVAGAEDAVQFIEHPGAAAALAAGCFINADDPPGEILAHEWNLGLGEQLDRLSRGPGDEWLHGIPVH
jgi:hypothetical protein